MCPRSNPSTNLRCIPRAARPEWGAPAQTSGYAACAFLRSSALGFSESGPGAKLLSTIPQRERSSRPVAHRRKPESGRQDNQANAERPIKYRSSVVRGVGCPRSADRILCAHDFCACSHNEHKVRDARRRRVWCGPSCSVKLLPRSRTCSARSAESTRTRGYATLQLAPLEVRVLRFQDVAPRRLCDQGCCIDLE